MSRLVFFPGRGSYQLSSAVVVATNAAALLLDTYPNAAFGFSFRKLRAAYAGSAVQLRRDSDNATKDIGFSGNDFDSASAASFIGAANGFIEKWYDQSGNSRDVVQATAASQPAYEATGFNSSFPRAKFLAANSNILASTAFDLSTSGYTVSGTHFILDQRPTTTGQAGITFGWFVSTSNETSWYTYYNDNNVYFDFGNDTGEIGTANSTVSSPHIYEAYRDNATFQAIVKDGVQIVGASGFSQVLSSASGVLSMGQVNFPGSSAFVDAGLTEIVSWGTDLGSTNRPGARNNINAYYHVF